MRYWELDWELALPALRRWFGRLFRLAEVGATKGEFRCNLRASLQGRSIVSVRKLYLARLPDQQLLYCV